MMVNKNILLACACGKHVPHVFLDLKGGSLLTEDVEAEVF